MDSSLGRDAADASADAAADAAAGGRGGRGVGAFDAMIGLDVVLWIETADPDLPSLVQFLR